MRKSFVTGNLAVMNLVQTSTCDALLQKRRDGRGVGFCCVSLVLALTKDDGGGSKHAMIFTKCDEIVSTKNVDSEV